MRPQFKFFFVLMLILFSVVGFRLADSRANQIQADAREFWGKAIHGHITSVRPEYWKDMNVVTICLPDHYCFGRVMKASYKKDELVTAWEAKNGQTFVRDSWAEYANSSHNWRSAPWPNTIGTYAWAATWVLLASAIAAALLTGLILHLSQKREQAATPLPT